MVRSHLIRPLLFILLALQLALHFALVALPVLQQGAPSFVSYFTASWLMVRGEFTPDVYDNEWFAAQTRIAMKDPTANDIISPNLPTVTFATLPLLLLPPDFAKATFTLLSWFVSWGVLLALLWLTRPRDEVAWLLTGSLLAWSAPISANLWAGQYYGFILAMMVGVWVLLRRGWDVLAGLFLGVAFMLKSAGAALFLLPLLYGRIRLWLGAGLAMAALFLGSLLWMQPNVWQAYLADVASVSERGTLGVTAYQTTAGFFSHMLRYDAQWNPYPLWNSPALARPLYLIVTLLTLLFTLYTIRRYRAPLSLGFALLLTWGVISVPLAEEHHFVVLLLPFLIITADWCASRHALPTWVGLALVGALVAIFVPLPYEHPRLAVGWWAVLAYPRLYGTWLLWAVGCVIARRLSPMPEMVNRTGSLPMR